MTTTNTTMMTMNMKAMTMTNSAPRPKQNTFGIKVLIAAISVVTTLVGWAGLARLTPPITTTQPQTTTLNPTNPTNPFSRPASPRLRTANPLGGFSLPWATTRSSR